MKPMNIRHEEFVRHYLTNGYQPADAYIAVYGENKKKCRIQSAKAAYKVLNKPAVKQFLEEFRNKEMDKFEASRVGIMEELKELIETCKEDKDKTHLLKSLDMINKMQGNYTQKTEVEHKGITFNFVKPEEVTDIDYEEVEDEDEDWEVNDNGFELPQDIIDQERSEHEERNREECECTECDCDDNCENCDCGCCGIKNYI